MTPIDLSQFDGATPGPWRTGDAGHTIFGPPTKNPSPRTVARLPKLATPCNVSSIDENIANAKLIAAAPALLAEIVKLRHALENIVNHAEIDGKTHNQREHNRLSIIAIAQSLLP